jgi:tellurite resistance protein TehA-like permease
VKIGNLEGTPEEIRDLFIATDTQLADYLEKPEDPLKPIWLIVPVLLFACTAIALVIASAVPKSVLLLLFLLGACAVVWLAIVIQIRFKNPWATSVAAVGGLLMLLVAAGFMTPKDTVDAIKVMKGKAE